MTRGNGRRVRQPNTLSTNCGIGFIDAAFFCADQKFEFMGFHVAVHFPPAQTRRLDRLIKLRAFSGLAYAYLEWLDGEQDGDFDCWLREQRAAPHHN